MLYLMLAASAALAGVEPLLETEWGQDEDWGTYTPIDASGEATPAGCTTIAAAQVLYHYRYQASGADAVGYGLDNDVTGTDIEDGWLYVDLPATTHDWDAMAKTDAPGSSS